ncbi:MAG TPA: BTAD domain-containing putative transcriptional regulator [Nakamurella sp.]|nr:BTAD domain-containing putative transcriptional regulator [Nakamurella sp.]
MRVLGEFSVDGLEPAALGSRKARTVLRLLTLGRGGFVPGHAIIDALWGERPPSKPADQLSVLVSRLRAVLGRERLEHGDNGYRLHYDWLDADELTALSAEVQRRLADGNARGAATAASAALSLIRGEVRSDGDLGDWAEAELAGLERLVISSRRVAASALAAAGNWLQASDLAAAAVERDPYDEDSLRLLMRVNVAGGRVGAALAAYARVRQRLAEELGADPSPATASLHAAILRGELAGPVPEVAGWTLVGRDGERDRLDAAAARSHDGRVQLVIVEGEAGIGKTSLLRAWAAARAARGDAVLFGTCGTLDRSAPLDALIAAIVDHLRRAGPVRTAEVLGPDDQLLGRLLGPTSPAGSMDMLAEGVIGPSMLFSALVGALQRIGLGAPVVLVLDDAHQAGQTLAEWLRFVLRRPVPLAIVTAVRSGEGALLPAGTTIDVGPLDRDAVRTLVGSSRLDQLFGRSHGHPLLLSELAASDAVELPASLVESVSARCDELGPASATLRGAAVIGGSRIDLDLLAGVLHRPVIELLDDVELGAARRLLIESDGVFAFRHDLIRAALAASATAGRSALLHREAARFLSDRIEADPIEVAHHAQLGGDLELAARALRAAAVRAAELFDHATAEGLLDDALRLHPDAEGWLDRARVRTRRGHYAGAYEDVARCSGAAALEVGAWASYFDRRFDQALQYAQDGELAADDPAVRARCLTVGGRTYHAAGDLESAEQQLNAAIELATGADRIVASAWLGVLRAHQSRVAEALRLLRPVIRHTGVEHTSALLHALLFTGHAHALAGRPQSALSAFEQYTAEVERRQVPRFGGRGVNFAGWVLRSTGAIEQGVDHHLEALDAASHGGIPEVRIAALEDLAEARLVAGDPDGTAALLGEAAAALQGDLVFGWRLEFKLRLLQGRLALDTGSPEQATVIAEALDADATGMRVPRYAAVARLLADRGRALQGLPVDPAGVASALDLLDSSVGIESWWWTGETAADLGSSHLLDRAVDRVALLAPEIGPRAAELHSDADRRLERWRKMISSRPARP